MYVIREALPKSFYPLAVLFSAAGMIGTLPMTQANQLTALIGQTVLGGAPPAVWFCHWACLGCIGWHCDFRRLAAGGKGRCAFARRGRGLRNHDALRGLNPHHGSTCAVVVDCF